MSIRSTLQSLRDRADELLRYADSGGDQEHAFNLMINEDVVHAADAALGGMLDDIETELHDRSCESDGEGS